MDIVYTIDPVLLRTFTGHFAKIKATAARRPYMDDARVLAKSWESAGTARALEGADRNYAAA